MGLEDIRRRESIDLAARAEFIRDELLPDLDAEIEAAEEQQAKYEAAGDDEDVAPPENPPQELRDTRNLLAKQADDCERVVDALGGDGEFVITELMADQTGLLKDDVAEQAVDVDERRQSVDVTPKEGFHRNRTLQLAIVDWPAGMDTTMDRELGRQVVDLSYMPDVIADYLYECVTSLNDAGSLDEVGNSLKHYGVTTSDKS